MLLFKNSTLLAFGLLLTLASCGGGGGDDGGADVDAVAYTAEACHPFHVKAATRTGAKLPPIGA